jgi:hypothetical protein
MLVDKDQNGNIDYEEFLEAVLSKKAGFMESSAAKLLNSEEEHLYQYKFELSRD